MFLQFFSFWIGFSFHSPLRSPIVTKQRSTSGFSSTLSFAWQLLWWGAQDRALRQRGRKEETHSLCLCCPIGCHTPGPSHLFLYFLLLHMLSYLCRLLLLLNLSATSIFLSISIVFPLLTLQVESHVSNINLWLTSCISFSCSPCLLRNAQVVNIVACFSLFLHDSCVQHEHNLWGGSSQTELRSGMNRDGTEDQDEHPAAWRREPVEMHIQIPQGRSESYRDAPRSRMEQGPVLLQASSTSERMAQTTAHITHYCGSSSGHTLLLLLILRSWLDCSWLLV